jgi:hypothetical protein
MADTKTDGAADAGADTKTTPAAGAAGDQAGKTVDTAGAGAATSEAGKTAAKTDEAGAKGKTGAEPGTADAAAKAAAKPPEKYDLKVPKGAAAYLDDADQKQLEAAYRKAGFTNDEAQAAFDNVLATLNAQAQRFLAETTADQTYGGDHLEETQRLAKAAIDRVRPVGHPRRDSFLAFLGKGGTGNHLEVVSFLADLGRKMGEDSPVHARAAGGGSANADPDAKAAAKLYGA